jgi:hypothetical protein
MSTNLTARIQKTALRLFDGFDRLTAGKLRAGELTVYDRDDFELLHTRRSAFRWSC